MSTMYQAGHLRALLRSANARWSVAERFGDHDVIPAYALGAEPPAGLVLAKDTPAVDLKTYVTDQTNNPFLLARRRATGMLGANAVAGAAEPLVGLNVSSEHVAELTAGAPPASLDWRNRFGWPWITKVKDQGGCQSCWAFGAVGVVESMARIEHAVWSKRSEGDVHDGMAMHCANGGWPSTALDWIKTHGVADPDCWGYFTDDRAYAPTADRNGRTTKIADYATLGTVVQQKQWLDSVGPITACFEVFSDFFGAGAGVYHKTNDPANTYQGNHCMLVVGYDDVLGCWICKNSYGPAWGNHGYVNIGYGEVNIDGWAKYGVQYTSPDPWTKRRLHNGTLIESGNGALHRNFEMLATQGSSIRHWWRDGSSVVWGSGALFGNDASTCPTLTSTTFGRNFESVYLTGGRRLHHWYFDQAAQDWRDGGVFGPVDAYGVPGFIQSRYGAPGNFEVVVRTLTGQLNHWWRDGGGWHDGGRFGTGIAYSGAALLQSRYGVNGNLELVAVNASGQMQHFWRDDDHGFVWHAGVSFGTNIYSPPVMIEGQFGAADEDRVGNFELCVQVAGSVQHWWRDNLGGTGWHQSAAFGHNVRSVIGIVESSFGFNLEVIVITNTGKLQHYWRDGGGWHDGVEFGSV